MIIVITDRKISAEPDFLRQVEVIADSSPDMIILREKDLSEAEYRYLAVECMRICSNCNVKFCVNSFIKTAAALNNGRVQVSFGSLTSNADKLKDFKEIWVSVHSRGEATEAERMGATHLIYGNVFETSCKPGVEGKGIKELREVCKAVGIPVFAVGGIDLSTAVAAVNAGCDGVCVRSLMMTSKDPAETVGELRKRIGRGGSLGRSGSYFV
ncbi:MAG: thiamine phosphate synthase [Candidatus Methanoplasma sp.]|jgi:thiamine-phosphate pyrophosphorylase|nr:thiamine phosphate synthase [Candidatus Methanoplasma sp.]